ncbi:MAG: DNA/RNA nuclease SfsA [Archangium sp.]|nr:DNA/RNA nuclease SfsA [Archangium sp.]MDP3573962.1 DNA/RNA nuclease SfsA [Archangium sp.]
MLWKWPTPLHEGRLVRRYERFIAEVQLGRTLVRAHCVNPGRMEGMVVPGARVWLSEAPGRHLPWTWELMEFEGRLIGANTSLPNKLVGEVLRQGLLPGLHDATAVHAERVFGRGHRVDFLLQHARGDHYVEVKNCHLVYPDGCGYFPDSVSERATGHVEALTRLVKKGIPATVIFTLLRDDPILLRPSAFHDPRFAAAMRRAVKAGLTARAIRLLPSIEGIDFGGEVRVDVSGSDVKQSKLWSAHYDLTSGWERKDGKFAGRALR